MNTKGNIYVVHDDLNLTLLKETRKQNLYLLNANMKSIPAGGCIDSYTTSHLNGLPSSSQKIRIIKP